MWRPGGDSRRETRIIGRRSAVDTQAGSEGAIRFGAFELDERTRELRSGTSRIRLQDQPFEILRLLLRRPGDVVTREELRRQLWPDGTFVDFEHSLNAAVKRLRAALGDDADNPRFVETLPRRGYRFVVSADASRAEPAVPQPRAAAGPPRRPALQQPGRRAPRVLRRWAARGADLAARRAVPRPHRRAGALVVAGVQGHLAAGPRGGRSAARRLPARRQRAARGRPRAGHRAPDRGGRRNPALGRDVRPPSHALPDGAGRRGRPDRPRARRRAGARRAHAHAIGSGLGRLPGVSRRVATSGTRPRTRRSTRRSPTTRRRCRSTPRSAPRPRRWPAPASRAPSTIARCRGSRSPRRATPRAARSTIDGSLYEAHLALGETQRMLDFDWAAAEASYLKALALNPSSESAHRAYALLLSALGRHREAVRESDRAIELDPLCLVVGGAAAWVAYASGDYPAAIEIARNTIDMDPEFVRAQTRARGGLPAVGAHRRRGAGARGVGGAHRPSGAAGWLAHAQRRSPAGRATPKQSWRGC